MSTLTTPELSAAGLGQRVPLSQIPEAVGQLFQDNDTSKDTGAERSGVTRASLLNFALYHEDQAAIAEDNDLLREIAAEIACRSILVSLNPTAREKRVSACLQAHCRLGNQTKDQSICSEQLSFCIDGSSPDLVRNTVFANLESDLPLALWWRGEFSDIFEERLYSRVNRLIFDSKVWTAQASHFLRVCQAQADSPRSFVMHDLSFSRLNTVRRTIASMFDRPKIHGRLSQLRKIRIEHRSGHRMSALYLAAWISRKLGTQLNLSRSTPDRFEFSNPSKIAGHDPLPIEVMPSEEDASHAAETSFFFGEEVLRITRCRSRAYLRGCLCNQQGEPKLEDWIPSGSSNDPQLVVGILQRAGQNRSLSEILPIVREMLSL